jgi:hypothetical protein
MKSNEGETVFHKEEPKESEEEEEDEDWEDEE